MDEKIKEELITKATELIDNKDPSHDLGHALRVLANAEFIANKIGADLDVVIPAALFHDSIIYPKNDPNSKYAADESAFLARKVLREISDFPKEKIARVSAAILSHSFSRGIIPKTDEARIVWDADKLECSGAISIMRAFCSTGQMSRGFFDFDDPFCKRREPEGFKFAIDFVVNRLLKTQDTLHFDISKDMCNDRAKFLHLFLDQLKTEIEV